MSDRNTDQLSLIHDSSSNQDTIGKSDIVHALERLDIAKFAAELCKTCGASFPAGYFSGCVWAILLELYQMDRKGEKMRLEDIAPKVELAESLVLRYVNALTEDGFVLQVDDPDDPAKNGVLLREKGRNHMDMLFAQLKSELITMMGLADLPALTDQEEAEEHPSVDASTTALA